MELEIFFEEKGKVNARLGNRVIPTDQPVSGGGDDSAPAPFDLFLASIGTCAGIYLKRFCDQRSIPTDQVRIIQHHHYNREERRIDRVELEAILPDDFPRKYLKAAIQSMDLCAVKKHLNNPPSFKTFTNLDD